MYRHDSWRRSARSSRYIYNVLYLKACSHVRTHFIDHNNLPDMLSRWVSLSLSVGERCRRRLFVELSIFMGDIDSDNDSDSSQQAVHSAKSESRAMFSALFLRIMRSYCACGCGVRIYGVICWLKYTRATERNVYNSRCAQCMQPRHSRHGRQRASEALYYRALLSRESKDVLPGGKTSKWRAYFNKHALARHATHDAQARYAKQYIVRADAGGG